ncbi:hypothetical protein B0H11DRAFT_1934571 [Mycena galericulata]|nr:hypothetical protein B0H11DRAFT_1934571 [Mycena galericulata]
MFCADGMFRPTRAKIRTSARARKTFFGDPPQKINFISQGSEIKFDISKLESVLLDLEHIFDLQKSLLNWYFNSIKGAESFIPPQDRTSISSQLGFRGPGHGVEKFSANSEPDSSPRRVGPGSDLSTATPYVALGIHIGFPDQPLSLHVTVKSVHSVTTCTLNFQHDHLASFGAFLSKWSSEGRRPLAYEVDFLWEITKEGFACARGSSDFRARGAKIARGGTCRPRKTCYGDQTSKFARGDTK